MRIQHRALTAAEISCAATSGCFLPSGEVSPRHAFLLHIQRYDLHLLPLNGARGCAALVGCRPVLYTNTDKHWWNLGVANVDKHVSGRRQICRFI